jgi:hypothetical protein
MKFILAEKKLLVSRLRLSAMHTPPTLYRGILLATLALNPR